MSRPHNYVLFEWDTVFAAYVYGLDAKELAYSSLITVIKSKTASGYVPNKATGGTWKAGHTEPPIGSKVTLELYRKYQDKWLVELLLDDLLDWNNWFVEKRTLQPAGLICLGGASMQNARFESGLDNSPM